MTAVRQALPAVTSGELLADPVVFDGAVRSDAGIAQEYPDHLATYGAAPDLDADAILDAVERSGVTGHGGGHFPAAVKWRGVRAAVRTRGPSVLVVNATEGEPDSRKDAALLAMRPHLVVDGISATMRAIGAGEVVLATNPGVDRGPLHRALVHRDVPVRVVVLPHRYLTGESSSLVNALGGGAAVPVFRRVPLARSGLDGRPTLVHNVETIARIALAIRGGDATGSLVTVAAGERRVVVESRRRTVGEIVVAALGSAFRSGVLVGGYGGRWLRWDDVAPVPATHDEFARRGASIGAGVLLPLRADECGLGRTAHIARWLADAGARQCGPCLFGLPSVAAIVEELADGSARRRNVRQLRAQLAQISGRGACHHPDGATAMIASALTAFAADVDAHLRGRCLHAPRGHRR